MSPVILPSLPRGSRPVGSPCTPPPTPRLRTLHAVRPIAKMRPQNPVPASHLRLVDLFISTWFVLRKALREASKEHTCSKIMVR